MGFPINYLICFFILFFQLFFSVQIFDALIKNGADVNFANENGRTALHIAAENGTLNFFKEKPKMCLKNGFIDSGNASVVRLLMENGANPDLKDNNRLTALELAVQKCEKNRRCSS